MKRKYCKLQIEAVNVCTTSVIAASGEAKNSMKLTEVSVESYVDEGSFDVSFGEVLL